MNHVLAQVMFFYQSKLCNTEGKKSSLEQFFLAVGQNNFGNKIPKQF